MKKFLSILLTLCLVFSALPMSVFATATANVSQVSTLTSGDWSYEFYGEGVCLTAYNGTAQDLTVPDKITVGDNEYQVLKLGDGLFQNSTTLNSATFGSGILEIGASAFKNCTNLVCVILNEELTTIGAEAFYGCTSFNSVIIYDAVTQIGENAFYNCSSLTVWCNENSYAYDYAIANNIPYEILNPLTKPETVILDGVTYLLADGEATAINCDKNVTEVTVPEKVNDCPVTKMKATFKNCEKLESVTLPESITEISDYLFFGCRKLTEIKIPNSVTEIHSSAFWGCTSLTKIEIPNGVKEIWGQVFGNCSSLKEVKIPNSVTRIDSYAFQGCTNLQKVIIPESVTSLSKTSFPSNTILMVYKDSYAHQFAEDNDLLYFVLRCTDSPEIAYGASVSGTVCYTDGTVASGAEVQIAYSDGVLKETVTADQNGEYKFTYAEVGEYTITALDTNGNVSSSTVAVKRMNVFDVFVSGDTALTLKKGYSIEGSASESEAQITLTDTDGGFVADTKANQNGKFKIANVQNGEYVLKAETDNGTAVCEVTVFDADVSGITLNIKNQTSQTANITGFVEVDLRNHNHDRRHWIEVKLYNENGVAVGSTRSDYDGKYVFCNIPLGEYTIVAETYEMRPDHHHGYDRSYKLTGYAYLDIEKSGNYTADTIVLYEENSYRATISGTVMSYGNLKNCTVTLTDVFRNEVATVNLENGNGRYRFTNVRDGMYFVTAVTRNSGMGYTTVVVREGRVYGETNIAIYKSEKIDTHEKGFYNDVPECKNKTEAEKYRKRIAQEKSFYDGLSSKEKKQLSCDYIERLNKLCEWIADCNYTATDGVTVSGGGLVTSGDQLQNKNNISFNVTVEKTDSYTPNPDGVKTDNDYLYHCINDATGENVV